MSGFCKLCWHQPEVNGFRIIAQLKSGLEGNGEISPPVSGQNFRCQKYTRIMLSYDLLQLLTEWPWTQQQPSSTLSAEVQVSYTVSFLQTCSFNNSNLSLCFPSPRSGSCFQKLYLCENLVFSFCLQLPS